MHGAIGIQGERGTFISGYYDATRKFEVSQIMPQFQGSAEEDTPNDRPCQLMLF